MILGLTQKFQGLLAATLAGLFFAAPGLAQGMRPGASWDWQLQPPLDLSVAVDVLGLDPDEVSAAQIATLTARGVTTICYVSVGTWENWRVDAGDFPQELIGKAYEGWPGERFLDIRAPELLALMQARFQRCAEMGFDAIEPDNIDLNINDTGFDLSAEDVVAYVSELAHLAHGLGLKIGQKNAPDLVAALHPVTDFAITEDCLADGWCAAMAPFIAHGKPVFAAEYGKVSAQACATAEALGLSLIFKHKDLTNWHATCPR